MKRYKLLKDLPTFKAGDLFYISEHGALVRNDGDGGEVGVTAYARQTLDMFPNILTEWFEEIPNPTDSIHWNPRIGEKCFILGNANIIPTLFTGKLRDYNAWRTGKIFRTEEECEKARDRELAEARLRRTSNAYPHRHYYPCGIGAVYRFHWPRQFCRNSPFPPLNVGGADQPAATELFPPRSRWQPG